MPTELHFLGAARQVTGSRYLLKVDDADRANGTMSIMIDCGLFQEREFLGRNWEMPLVAPGSVDAMVLTHAHLDHSGLIPRLVAGGFDQQIVTTEPTVELAELIMLDSARIQQEDVAYKKRRHRKEGRKSPHREEPLYGTPDAERAVKLLRGVPYGERVELSGSVAVTFHEAGHILGSAILEFELRDGDQIKRVIFSGDIGQWDKPLIGDPTLLERADVVVMESTYGNRNHRDHGPVDAQLAEVINDTARRGGNIVIPTFAIERAQDLIYHFGLLRRNGTIPELPIYLDSPMAVDVTEIFRRYRHYLDEPTQRLFDSGHPPLRYRGLHLCRSVHESKRINRASSPKIILATSGMCTAGRIKHHLRRNIGRADSTICFVGYQAHGTLGREILEGSPRVRIHGKPYAVEARIAHINGFSAHGDRDDLLRWLGNFQTPPRQVFLTHGEADVAEALAKEIEATLDTKATVPEYRQVCEV